MEAFVLIEVKSGKVKNVLTKVKKIEGVKIAHAVVGPYDIIAHIEAENLEELGSAVVNKIQGIDGIERTLTAIAVEL